MAGSDEGIVNTLDTDPALATQTDDFVISESDSGYWALSPSTQSVTTSIYNYEHAHGRTYHAYSQGAYVFPNDADENLRVEIFYHAVRLALNDTLFFAPLVEPRSILDIGTGTGIWCIDVADAHPGANVIGTDLSPIQPTYVPPNCTFEIADAEEESDWNFTQSFDLIHTRIMIDMAIKSWPDLFRRAYESLSPGGWIECQEFDYHRRSDDDTISPDSKLKRWEEEWTRAINMMGLMGYCDPDKVEAQMRGAGFSNVHTKHFKLPIGPWAKDKRLKEAGLFGMVNLLEGMHGLSVKLFTDLLGYSQQELEKLVEECKEEVLKKKVHSYYPVYVVLGQKVVE